MQKENKPESPDLIGDDLDGDILDPPKDEAVSPWDKEEAEPDVYDEKDSTTSREIYVMGIPNEPKLKSGADNPGYRKVCFDKEMTIPPADSVQCVVLKRIRPNIEQVPFNESKGLEPWEKILGYSLDSIRPTPNTQGEYFPSCISSETGMPYCRCSSPSVFEDGEVVEKEIDTDIEEDITKKIFPYLKSKEVIKAKGECYRGRWANTIPEATRKALGVRSIKDKPICDHHIIIYAWHLGERFLFSGYFKRASLKGADNFLASFKRNIGPETKRLKLPSRVAEITVKDCGQYAIPVISNTGREANYTQIKPIMEWFKEREGRFVRNTSVSLEEMKEQADFKPGG